MGDCITEFIYIYLSSVCPDGFGLEAVPKESTRKNGRVGCRGVELGLVSLNPSTLACCIYRRI